MLTWNILAFVHIQWLALSFLVLLIHVTRDCGEDIYVLQTPTGADMHVAADVKDTARIQTQCLFVHPGGRMTPRVPSKAIAFDSATAERLRDLSQKHIEVASQELYAMVSDLLRQSIQKIIQYIWPLKFHGAVMPMHSTNDDLFSK
jgi:hypothetical protein